MESYVTVYLTLCMSKMKGNTFIPIKSACESLASSPCGPVSAAFALTGPQHRAATKAPLLAAAALPWPQVVHEAHS
jgi:hypothetical protein